MNEKINLIWLLASLHFTLTKVQREQAVAQFEARRLLVPGQINV